MRKIIATVVAGLAMFMLAGLYTGVIAKGFMTANVDANMIRMQPNMMLIASGYLFLAALMTLIFPHIKDLTAGSVKSGVVFGMVSGIVWMMPYSLVLFGVYRFPYIAISVDFVWALVEQGIGGILISLILGMHKRI
jgi:hypothetical protein